MILFTGSGTAGSWKIRGEQIGKALGAKVKPQARLSDFAGARLAVMVKRTPDACLCDLRASGVPWVFDIVDCYPQPECATWGMDKAIRWMRDRLQRLQPTAVIWPNAMMQSDVGFTGPQAVIYHHHWPGIKINPIRKDIRQVGYEGSPAYLGSWRTVIESECDKRNWGFVVNPKHLADVDIVIAVRGNDHDCYVTRNWKSNVKLANAHGSGTPFIGATEKAYVETATGCEYWADNLGSLRMSFDWLTDQRNREQISDRFLQRAYPVERAAADYSEFLSCVSKSC